MTAKETLQLLYTEVLQVYRILENENEPDQLRNLENFLAIAQEGLENKLAPEAALKEMIEEMRAAFGTRVFNDGVTVWHADKEETQRINRTLANHMETIWGLMKAH